MKLLLSDRSSDPTAAPTRTKQLLLKGLLLASAALLLLSFSVYALRAPLLTAVARLLIVVDDPQAADIIMVLNGGEDERAVRAGQLFKQGLAPRIAIATSEETPTVALGLLPRATDVAVELMKSLGVPGDSITVLPFEQGVTSTRDEAIALRTYVEAHDIERVIIVTSALHTRRARGIFTKLLSRSSVALQVVAAPHREFDETNWWQTESGLVAVNNEYIKVIYYMLRY